VNLYKLKMIFTWKGVLENNINHILEFNLTAYVIGLNWLFNIQHFLFLLVISSIEM
jgi:hypothetical protein